MTKKVALLISVGILFMTSACSNTPKQISADSAPTAQHTGTNGAPTVVQARPTEAEKEEAARKARLVEAQQKAEQEKSAIVAIQQHISHRYSSHIKLIRGRRFSASQTVALDWLQELLNKIPKHDYVDLVSMYKAIGGFDGSTTRDALARCQRSFVGKYYMLQGDVFQIQADRDYPIDGENEFMLFGQVNLPPFMPVNVAATSDEKVPPYRVSPMLTKIVGFSLGTNRAGKSIIVPNVEVVVVVSGSSFSDEPSDIVISEPTILVHLLGLSPQAQGSDEQSSASVEPTE